MRMQRQGTAAGAAQGKEEEGPAAVERVETVRVMDSSGGAGRSATGGAPAASTGSADGVGATKDNSEGSGPTESSAGCRGSGAAARGGADAGRYNCVAV